MEEKQYITESCPTLRAPPVQHVLYRREDLRLILPVSADEKVNATFTLELSNDFYRLYWEFTCEN